MQLWIHRPSIRSVFGPTPLSIKEVGASKAIRELMSQFGAGSLSVTVCKGVDLIRTERTPKNERTIRCKRKPSVDKATEAGK